MVLRKAEVLNKMSCSFVKGEGQKRSLWHPCSALTPTAMDKPQNHDVIASLCNVCNTPRLIPCSFAQPFELMY